MSPHSPRALTASLAALLAAAAAALAEPQVRDAPQVDIEVEEPLDADERATIDNAAEEMVLPIPVGHEVKGIRVPYFDVYGAKQLDFFAAQARRIDADNIRMTDVELEFFDDKGVSDITVFMPVAVFNMQTQLLGSDQPVRIQRDDFVLTGKKLVFHVGRRTGKLSGSVKMRIFDKDNL